MRIKTVLKLKNFSIRKYLRLKCFLCVCVCVYFFCLKLSKCKYKFWLNYIIIKSLQTNNGLEIDVE